MCLQKDRCLTYGDYFSMHWYAHSLLRSEALAQEVSTLTTPVALHLPWKDLVITTTNCHDTMADDAVASD